MAKLIGKVLVSLIVALAVLFLGDLAIWRARVAMGGGMGTVNVSRIQVASLKGNKEEYYWDGTTDVDCSKSLFPQAGAGACWWVVRHAVQFER
jgi:hypothetical protein